MIKTSIFTPTGSRSFTAEAVFLPGSKAPFEVLPGHEAIISTLEEGTIRWRTGEGEESLSIKTGVARLKDNELQICVEP